MVEQLWQACSDGNVEEAGSLLQNSKINTNRQDSELKRTPFYRACEFGYIEIVKLLLNDKRVDINRTNKRIVTPFFSACRNGHIDIVKILLKDNRVDINKVDNDGRTPFYIACSNEHTEIVKLLLNDERIDLNRSSLLHFTCHSGYIQGVQHILAMRREINLNVQDYQGMTPIRRAKEGKEMMRFCESEKEFEERSRNCTIIELLESFLRNPNETRTKLRIQLGLDGKSI